MFPFTKYGLVLLILAKVKYIMGCLVKSHLMHTRIIWSVLGVGTVLV